MGFRTVYGLNYSENGWRMVDAAGCTTAKIPGTGLSLPFRAGDAQTVLTAWAAWFNANVESLNNPGRGYADEGSFTWTNSVASSNHLSGTAMDLNWNDHAFRVSYSGFTSAEIAAVRRGLALFNKCIWWGQDWTSPKDSMHFQLNFPEGDSRIAALAKQLRGGYLGIYAPGGPEVSTPVAPAASGDVLEYGSHGDQVKILQVGFNKVFPSYPGLPLVVDGDFGPRTQRVDAPGLLPGPQDRDSDQGPDSDRHHCPIRLDPVSCRDLLGGRQWRHHPRSIHRRCSRHPVGCHDDSLRDRPVGELQQGAGNLVCGRIAERGGRSDVDRTDSPPRRCRQRRPETRRRHDRPVRLAHRDNGCRLHRRHWAHSLRGAGPVIKAAAVPPRLPGEIDKMSTVNITNAAMNFLGDGVRCPQCIEQGLTSRVDVLYTLSDAVHIPDYYDEDGNYHPAGRPPATTYCRCSNGHRFTFAS